MNDNTLVNFGGEIKSIDVNGTLARVGGYGILWGTPDQRDLAGDFFTPDTYLGAHKGEGVDTLLHHGIPLKAELAQYADIILPPTVKTTIDDHGLFVETIVDLADSYQAKIYDMVEKGKLRWSSGASPHMVKRADNRKAGEIKRWPIVEFSYTPTPCEFRGTEITSLKALFDAESESEVEAKADPVFQPYALADAGIQAVRSLVDRLTYGVLYEVLAASTAPVAFGLTTSTPPTQAQRLEYLGRALDEFKDLTVSVITAILTSGEAEAETAAKALGEMKSLLTLEAGQLGGSRFVDHSDRVLAANEEFMDRLQGLVSVRASRKSGRVLSADNLSRLRSQHDGLVSVIDDLRKLLDIHDVESQMNTEPTPDTKPAVKSEEDIAALILAEELRFEVIRAGTNGVPLLV